MTTVELLILTALLAVAIGVVGIVVAIPRYLLVIGYLLCGVLVLYAVFRTPGTG